MEINDIIKNHTKLNEIFGWGKKEEPPVELSPEEKEAQLAAEKKARDERIAAGIAKAKAEWDYEQTPMGQRDKEEYLRAQQKDREDDRQAAMDRHNAEIERLSNNIRYGDIRFTPYQLDQMRTELKALQAKQW